MRRLGSALAAVGALAMVEAVVIAAAFQVVGDGWATFIWEWGFAEMSMVLNFAVVGGVVAAKRPTNPIGWLMLLFAWQAAASSLKVTAVLAVPWTGILAAIILLFPHGRPLSRRWAVVVGAVLTVDLAVAAGVQFSVSVGGESIWDFLEPFLVLSLLPAALSVVLRYRRGVGVERLQLRVLAVSCGAAVVAVFISAPFGLLPIVNGLAIPAVAWGLAVAVLRYRLYDLGRIVSRTISYSLLSALLVAAYAAVVTGLGAVFRPSASSDLTVAVATLTVAALFAPLRRRIQTVVDRRFNRARYDAAVIVSNFSNALRDQLDADAVAMSIGDVVEQIMQPSRVSVWTAPRQ